MVLLFALACSQPPVPTAITAWANPDIVTVIHVSWQTEEPTIGRVHFGDSTTYDQVTPWESAPVTDHEVVLLGNHADTAVHFQVEVADDKGEAVLSDDLSFTTDPLPSDIPTFEVLQPITSARVGPWLLTSTQTADGTSALLVIDPSGQPVWYWRPSAGVESVRPTLDGQGVATVVGSVTDYSLGTILSVTWDGQATELPFPHAHHDLIALPDGTRITLVASYQEIDGVTVAGDQIVEIDAAGGSRVLWDAFEELPVVENSGWTVSRLPGIADWTHANGITYADDALYVSLYFPEQVVKVDRATGATVWRLGGEGSDFDTPGAAAFGPQHAPEVGPGVIRLFDNGDGSGSRVVELALDEAAGVATLAWSWAPASPAWTPLLGDVHRLDDGSAIATWGASGDLYAIDASGQEAGHLHPSAIAALGQVTLIDSFYPED